MNISHGQTECSEAATRVFYFLMAATAFLAASSRLSAAVMGRPLSVRILLASWTLVPRRHRRTLLQQVTANLTQKSGLTRLKPIYHLRSCSKPHCVKDEEFLWQNQTTLMTDGWSYG